MNIHHLNCASLHPLSARLSNGHGRLLGRGRLIEHCLLIKSSIGLILVNTGLGLQDIYRPNRLGKTFLYFFKPRFAQEETAIAQLKKMGYEPEDVKHIILTNLGLEKDGGLSDFPLAKVHVFAKEYECAMARKTVSERLRYVPEHWSHHPDWVLHRLPKPCQKWFGFDCMKLFSMDLQGEGQTEELELLLIPLPGHTAGHCGVAIKHKKGWILHCGNAYFSHKQMDKENPSCPPGMAFLQEGLDYHHVLREKTQERLRYLMHHHKDEVQIFCSNDPTEFSKLLKMRLD